MSRRLRFGCLILFLVLLLPGALRAQSAEGVIEGRITGGSGEALPSVNVVARCVETTRGTTTGAEGRYRIEGLPAAACRVTASIVGFGTRTEQVRLGQGGAPITVDFQLQSQRYGLDEVVVSAARTATYRSTVPSSISILPPEEIERQTALTSDLGSILAQRVPGLSPSTGTLSNYGQTLRGRDLFVLIDGIPQSTPLRDAARSLRTIDPSAIERVEVVRGASALYGYGATGGAINIVTKQPAEDLELHSEVGARFSPADVGESFSGRLAQRVSGRTGPFDYTVSGAYEGWGYFFDAEGDRIPQDPHAQGGLAGANEYDVFARAGLQLAPGQRLELSANLFDFKQDISYFTAVDTTTGFQKTQAQPADEVQGENPGTTNLVASLRYTHDGLLGSRLSARAFFQDYETLFGYATYFPDGGGQSYVHSKKFGARLDVETPLPEATGSTLLWGVDLLRDETAQPLEDGRPYVPPMRQTSAAPFAQLKLVAGQRAVLRGGLRYETIGLRVDDFTTLFEGNAVAGGTLSYDALLANVGGVLFLTDRVEAFGSFAQGFSVADVGRTLRDTQAESVEQLKPEAQKVNSYELGLRAGFGGLRATATGFVNTSELGTVFGDLPELAIIRSPEQIYGVELTLDAQPHGAFGLGGTLTYLEGKRDADEDGDYETALTGDRIPPLKLTGFVSYAPLDGWQNRLQVLHSGPRAPFGSSSVYAEGSVEAYTTVDFYSAFEVGPGTLKLGLTNLFDTFYFPPISQWYNLESGYAAAPGRSMSLTYAVTW